MRKYQLFLCIVCALLTYFCGSNAAALAVSYSFDLSSGLENGSWGELFGCDPVSGLPTPGSPGSILWAGADTGQWLLADAELTAVKEIADPNSAYQYESLYEGGMLSLSEAGGLWGDAVLLPVTAVNYSRQRVEGDTVYLNFEMFITGLLDGKEYRAHALFSGQTLLAMDDFDLMGMSSLNTGDYTIFGGGHSGYGFDKLSLEINAVPEPTTLLLLGTGLIGLAGVGRKKLTKR